MIMLLFISVVIVIAFVTTWSEWLFDVILLKGNLDQSFSHVPMSNFS